MHRAKLTIIIEAINQGDADAMIDAIQNQIGDIIDNASQENEFFPDDEANEGIYVVPSYESENRFETNED